MAIRFRKYFSQCKEISCNGKKRRHCPDNRPKNKQDKYRKCGHWVVELFDENKKWVSLTFKDVRNKTEAEKRLVLLLGDKERGNLNLPRKKKIPTLEEYSKEYLSLFASNGVKENTVSQKKRAIKALTKVMGEHRLDKIIPFLIEKYRIDKQKAGLKPRSINIDIAVLSHIMNQALKENLISKNPCSEIKRLKTEQSRDRILSDAEIDLVINNTKGKDRLMILTSLFTGMRLNEVLGLTWNDIDFQNRLITFTQSKTGKMINIPLSNFLADELARYKEMNNNGESVFNIIKVNRTSISKFSAYFSELFKSLGIQCFTFHRLRHTHASIQCGVGTDLITIQSLLGHADVSQTMRYSHSQIGLKIAAINNIETKILDAAKTKVISVNS